MLDNRAYYDQFAEWYELERHDGYHALIDDLEFGIVEPYCGGAEVLEVGCGTGLILRRVEKVAERAVGVDISPGMLALAKKRGLDVVEGSATDLPFEDESFDTVYSFKVLAHIEQIRRAIRECARVTRPGGRILLEFYNRRSLRYLAKRIAKPGAVAADLDESHVFTRWDTLGEIRQMLPHNLELIDAAGVRVISPGAFAHKVPGIRRVLRRAEFRLCRSRLARFGGFLIAILRKAPAPDVDVLFTEA